MNAKATHVTALLVSWAMFAAPSHADWNTYLNGNARAGYSPVTLAPDLKLAWTYKSPAKPMKAWAGPRAEPIEGHLMKHRVNFDDAMQVVMQDGRVYFGSVVDHRLHCVDAKTGDPIWSFRTEGPIRWHPHSHTATSTSVPMTAWSTASRVMAAWFGSSVSVRTMTDCCHAER